MQITIEPKKYNTYDCYQNNIISVLGNYFKIDYRPFFWSGFDFRFLIDRSKEYINLTGYNTYQDQILSEQCGVKIKCINKTSLQQFKQIILKELQDSKPIGFRLNGSDLRWSNNRNIDYHYILIIGIDLLNSCLYCCDGFLSDEIQKVDIIYIYEKVEYMLTFCISECYEKSFILSREKFIECLDHNNKRKNDDVLYFIDSVDELFEKMKGTDPNNNPIIFQLSRVCWSRYNFLKSLEYFYDNFGFKNSEYVIKYSNYAIESWMKLKNLFIKAIIVGSIQQVYKYGTDFIKVIIETETAIQQYLEDAKPQ